MTYDLPCMSYMAMYIISVHIVNSNSKSSVGANHWKLNIEEGKVLQADDETAGNSKGSEDDHLFTILKNRKVENGEWKVDSELECQSCQSNNFHGEESVERKNIWLFGWKILCRHYKIGFGIRKKEEMEDLQDRIHIQKSEQKGNKNIDRKKNILTCGKTANYTQYDHLRGITNRNEHPHIPEPEVAIMFRRKGSKTSDIDMNELEIRLKKLKKQQPKSSGTFSQIGNFWRIKGNTQLSIECFRKSLMISPNSPDILLYLARVLFNLQYLDDAIFLTRRSLVMQSPDDNSWHQHFTLGEILKAYGHYQEAALHFHHALELNPGFQRAEAHLRDMEGAPNPSITQYTLFIILFLVMGVIFGVITSMEAGYDETSEGKPQRHFNRAMAMRSIKLGINPRLIRLRKLNAP